MEDQFDFQIDYENMPNSLPIPQTPVNEAFQDDNAYIETEVDGKKVYMCSDCGKVFKYPSQVSRHNIIHKKDRPYSCTFQGCNKSFKRADILESHMQLHTVNLPFVCDEPGCDRSFASKPALKYHKIRHTNNRIFKCEFEGCGKSFLLASQLKQHEKTVNYHIDDVAPPELAPSEKKDPQYYLNRLNPDQSELQRLMSGPSTEAEWKIMTQKCKGLRTEEGVQESFRLFFNYLISENLVLKEQAKKDKQAMQAAQINPGSFIFSSNSHSPISQLSRLSEHLDSDELKYLEYLKENAESRV